MTFGFTSPARRSGAYFAKKRAKRDLIDAAVREAMKRMQYEDDLQSLANREPPPPEPEPVVAKVDAPMTVNVSVQPQPARHKTIRMKRDQHGNLIADVIESDQPQPAFRKVDDVRRAVLFK